MEDSKSPPAATVEPICSTHVRFPQCWHLQYHYAKCCKSKSSLILLIGGCISVIAFSYAVLLSAPSNTFVNSPFLSARVGSFFGIPPKNYEQAIDLNQTDERVTEVLERAAMRNRTVIITTLNAAWAKEGTMMDMFLESFSHGNGTCELLQHLVVVCVDDKAYQRCLLIHPHCIYIRTHGVNFSGEQLLHSADYNKLMWRRVKFLKTVLQMNYSFIFTDTDVLWLRNPFPLLQKDTEADFQIACDRYIGRPSDVSNSPNAGFIYVRANARTVRFYDYWYEERKRSSNMADQEVFNAIKFDKKFRSIGMKLRFLDTQSFGGLCALKYTDMTKAITMHANCCKGLEAKLIDLRMMLEGWKKWHARNCTTMTTIVQSRDVVVMPYLHNESSSKLDPRFKVPLACPQSRHKH